jgi:hypothetical protein
MQNSASLTFCPHFKQNLEPAGIAEWQLAHCMAAALG